MFRLERNLWLLFALNIAIGFSNQFIVPLFPLYLEHLNASEMEIGLVISLASVAATAMMLPSGLLMDKLGKKRMLLLSVIFSGLPPFFIVYMRNWKIVIPFYMIFNVAFSLFIPARMAMVAQGATPESRATLFGLMNMAWPISGIIAPTLSGYIAENYGWGLTFYVSTAVMLVSLLPTIMLKEWTGLQERGLHKQKGKSRFDRTYVPFLAMFFLFHLSMTTGQGSVSTILPIYLKNQIELSTSLIGLFFTGSSVLTLITQIPSGWLADRYGKKKLIIACISPIPLLYGIWALINDWVMLLILYSVAFGLWSMTWPATLALLSDAVPGELRGFAFGVRMTGVRLGFTVGPLIAGYLYSYISNSSPFTISTIFYLIGIILALLLKESSKS